MLKRIIILTLVSISLTGCCIFDPGSASLSAEAVPMEEVVTPLDGEPT